MLLIVLYSVWVLMMFFSQWNFILCQNQYFVGYVRQILEFVKTKLLVGSSKTHNDQSTGDFYMWYEEWDELTIVRYRHRRASHHIFPQRRVKFPRLKRFGLIRPSQQLGSYWQVAEAGETVFGWCSTFTLNHSPVSCSSGPVTWRIRSAPQKVVLRGICIVWV